MSCSGPCIGRVATGQQYSTHKIERGSWHSLQLPADCTAQRKTTVCAARVGILVIAEKRAVNAERPVPVFMPLSFGG
jgi:hypothetical protein